MECIIENMIRTKKPEIKKDILVDKNRKVMIIRKNAVIGRKIKFDGKVIVGMSACVWGDIHCDELNTGKNTILSGNVKCRKAVLGSRTEFNYLSAKEVILQNRCKGKHLKAETAILRKNVSIEKLESETAYLDGVSSLGEVLAKKVVASKTEE